MTFETFLDQAWADHATHIARLTQDIGARAFELTTEAKLLALISAWCADTLQKVKVRK